MKQQTSSDSYSFEMNQNTKTQDKLSILIKLIYYSVLRMMRNHYK